ncbi:MAG: ribosome small subunit-dependent GTPase A [Candidatus Sericytochromatia bacterium]|nr:ribosome small subunit-dependent GTPase A [Candidatus Sericytochromatia bacterium]
MAGAAPSLEGTVVRRVNNVFWVRAGDRDWACQVRARLRKEQGAVLIGDTVTLDGLDPANDLAVISALAPRRNALRRPSVANVDQVVVVVASDEPEFQPGTLDRFLILVHMSGLEPRIVWTKTDLVPDAVARERVEHYRSVGYAATAVSVRRDEMGELPMWLSGRITVLAGPSGVGKSALVNALSPGLALREGEVSERSGRGRHTTTFASLHSVHGGLVADTPGYSHLALPDWPPEDLAWVFPEAAPHAAGCPLSKCSHRNEPGCRVVASGAMSESRRASYLRFVDELEEAWRLRQQSSRKVEAGTKWTGGAREGEGRRLVRLPGEARADSRRLANQRLRDQLGEAEDEGGEPTGDDVAPWYDQPRRRERP